MSPRATLAVHGVGGRERPVVRAEGPSLLLTIESGVVHVTSSGIEHVVDRSGCLLVPRGARFGLRAATPARVAAIAFLDPVLDLVARTYRKLGVDRGGLDRWTRRHELLPRPLWLHEIVHRYVFERYALGEDDNAATRFLETEIVKELHFLFRDRDAGADRESVVRRYSGPVDRALAHVEANLFEAPSVDVLAARAGTSESTLLRSFRREVGLTPIAYWRSRKLDEALVLLRSGQHSIAEVATRVGYDNPTSFAFAFRSRFGEPPSAFIPRTRTRRAP